ncbi:DUF4393 domain-containing protein [Mycolicibacter sinensis]
MTGIEPAAIAGAAAKAVGKAAEEDPKEKEQLRKIAENTGALDPAAKILAKRIAMKQHVRLKLLQPLGMLFGVSRDYFATDFESEMADRLQDIPEEELMTPSMNVAGPVVQGISFTVDEPDLRAMYLNLLATASDRRVQQAAHPSFAEIIRQLSAEEAKWLAGVLPSGQEPMVEIRAEDNPGGGYRVLATNVLDWVETNGEHVSRPEHSLYVDNWQRLGLVNIDFGAHLARDDAYGWVESNPLFTALRSQHSSGGTKVKFEKGILRVTEFGRTFFEVVIAPRSTRAIEPAPSTE